MLLKTARVVISLNSSRIRRSRQNLPHTWALNRNACHVMPILTRVLFLLIVQVVMILLHLNLLPSSTITRPDSHYEESMLKLIVCYVIRNRWSMGKRCRNLPGSPIQIAPAVTKMFMTINLDRPARNVIRKHPFTRSKE